MLLFEYDLDILDTRNLELVFFPVLLHNAVLFFKRCLADVVEKGQSVFLKYSVQRQISTAFLRTGFVDMRTYQRLRRKRTICYKVREIFTILFVKFFAAFVNISSKRSTIRMYSGHVVWDCSCSPWIRVDTKFSWTVIRRWTLLFH